MNAWIFDVDGVLTNLYSKKIEHPEILQIISNKLESNEPVGIISGRTISKILSIVIRPSKLYDEGTLEYLINS